VSDVRHADVGDLGIEFTPETAADLRETLEGYVKAFAKPVRREAGNDLVGQHLCLKCGESLDGFLIGTFEWGLAHGEGHCSKCGWPARAYHFIKHNGEDLFTGPLRRILQYHPDVVEAAPKPSPPTGPIRGRRSEMPLDSAGYVKTETQLVRDLLNMRAVLETSWWNGCHGSGGTNCLITASIGVGWDRKPAVDGAVKKALGVKTLEDVVAFNDTHTHAEVLALIDRAIEQATA